VTVDPDVIRMAHRDAQYIGAMTDPNATPANDPMYGFQPYGVIENVVVLPALRGQRVGAALMSGLEQVARAARCTKLMLLSSRARADAHAFFLRLGFDGERKREFVKYLNRAR